MGSGDGRGSSCQVLAGGTAAVVVTVCMWVCGVPMLISGSVLLALRNNHDWDDDDDDDDDHDDDYDDLMQVYLYVGILLIVISLLLLVIGVVFVVCLCTGCSGKRTGKHATRETGGGQVSVIALPTTATYPATYESTPRSYPTDYPGGSSSYPMQQFYPQEQPPAYSPNNMYDSSFSQQGATAPPYEARQAGATSGHDVADTNAINESIGEMKKEKC